MRTNGYQKGGWTLGGRRIPERQRQKASRFATYAMKQKHKGMRDGREILNGFIIKIRFAADGSWRLDMKGREREKLKTLEAVFLARCQFNTVYLFRHLDSPFDMSGRVPVRTCSRQFQPLARWQNSAYRFKERNYIRSAGRCA